MSDDVRSGFRLTGILAFISAALALSNGSHGWGTALLVVGAVAFVVAYVL